MTKRIKASMQTLVGVVIPYAWDESDRVIEVSLSATDDEEYIIENGEHFLDLVQKSIRAIGIVKSGKKLHQAIYIKKFEELDNTSFTE
jgi:aromatic ring-opening dioxygenase catalytic subunit (LigB family)